MNLERAKECIAQIEALQTELAAIFAAGGGTSFPVTSPAVDPIEPGKLKQFLDPARGDKPMTRKQRVCSTCGKPGHDVRKCPNAQGMHPDNPKKESAPLDKTQYEHVQNAMHLKEFQSARYALTNKLSPKEVNIAVMSTSYEDYRESR